MSRLRAWSSRCGAWEEAIYIWSAGDIQSNKQGVIDRESWIVMETTLATQFFHWQFSPKSLSVLLFYFILLNH